VASFKLRPLCSRGWCVADDVVAYSLTLWTDLCHPSTRKTNRIGT